MSVEFEAVVVPGGTITVPGEYMDHGGIHEGERLHVRLTRKRLMSVLQRRGVTEEEIEAIAKLQLEPREQVVKFLMTEGSIGRLRRNTTGKKAHKGARS